MRTRILARVPSPPHEVHANRIDAPELHRFERIRDVPTALAHLHAVHRPVAVRQEGLREREVEGEQDGGKVEGVEAGSADVSFRLEQ